MSRINNSELNNEITDATRIQSASSDFPNTLGSVVIPVIDVNPKTKKPIVVLGSNQKTTTGNQTLFTAAAGKDTFITGIILDMVKDATCDIASGGVSTVFATIGGTSVILARISGLTLTAERSQLTLNFGPIGIRMDRSGSCSIGGSAFTAGSLVRSAVVFGYTSEVSYVQ